jgi:hypothetical protein
MGLGIPWLPFVNRKKPKFFFLHRIMDGRNSMAITPMKIIGISFFSCLTWQGGFTIVQVTL